MNDWTLLGMAMDHYAARGFAPVNAPWTCSWETTMATCPNRDGVFAISPDETLVGSSEQSLLEMQVGGLLPPGKRVACTPCFRNETQLDELHLRFFTKVELHANDGATGDDLLDEAMAFFRSVLEPSETKHLRVVPSDCGRDIELGRIEIGSYGERSRMGQSWAFGTGVAVPRFSQARARCASS